jgi:opacity protein-like surface antigen
MNRLVIVILAGLLLIGSVDAEAQGEGKPYFQFNTGFSIPVSEAMSEFSGSGLALGVGAGYILNHKFTILASIDYNRFKLNQGRRLSQLSLSPENATIENGDITTFSGFVKIKMGGTRRVEVKMSPYVIAGAGIFRFKSEEQTLVAPLLGLREQQSLEVSETRLGISGGGGVNIRLTDRIDIYLEGGMVVGFTPGSSTQYFPVKVGLALQ